MRGRLQLARAFLVLAVALALCFASLVAWLLSPDVSAPRLAALAAAAGAALAALGLCMTRGDPGDPLRNAAKTLAVLLALLGGCLVLFLWAASSRGGGE